MPKTILLADDSVTIQKVVGISFANEDVVLLTVDNGDEALNRARESRPDIVLADIVMPGMSGYEVCAALRADSELRNVPVLLLSGTFETFDEDRARDVGADGHITKPFEAQALVDQVNELLARATPDPLSVPESGNSHTTLLEPSQAPAYDFFDDEMAAPAVAPEATPVAETTLLASDPNDDSAVGQVFDLEPLEDSQSGSHANAIGTEDPFDAVPLAEPVMATPAFTPAGETELVASDAPVDTGAAFGSSIDEAEESDAFSAAFETEEVLASSSAAFSFDEDEFGGALQSEAPAALAASSDDGADLFRAGDSFPALDTDPSGPASPAAEADPEPFASANFATQQVDSQDEWGSPAPEADVLSRSTDDAVAEVQATEDVVQSAEPELHSPPPVAEPAIEATTQVDPSDTLPVMPLALQERVHETLERVAWEAMGDLSERVVKEALNRIEAIAWEVIPQMAETLIREEIDRMKDGDDS